jgi:sulfur carrier protein ThiS
MREWLQVAPSDSISAEPTAIGQVALAFLRQFPVNVTTPGPVHSAAMRVEVHLHAELARLAPQQRGVVNLDLPEGTRVADLLQRFSLMEREQRIIVGVNGESAPPEQELIDGARIDLLTPMAGGSPARSFENTCRTVTGTASSTSI